MTLKILQIKKLTSIFIEESSTQRFAYCSGIVLSSFDLTLMNPMLKIHIGELGLLPFSIGTINVGAFILIFKSILISLRLF